MKLKGGFEWAYDFDLGIDLGIGKPRKGSNYPWYICFHLVLGKPMVWIELTGN